MRCVGGKARRTQQHGTPSGTPRAALRNATQHTRTMVWSRSETSTKRGRGTACSAARMLVAAAVAIARSCCSCDTRGEEVRHPGERCQQRA